jgi:hypothetical protein
MTFDPKRDGFRIDRVGLSGGLGGLVAIAGLVMILSIKLLRWPAFYTLLAGAVFGIGLAYWRRR